MQAAHPHGRGIDFHERSDDPVHLTELLTPDRIKIPLASTSKDEILSELVEVVGSNSSVRDLEEILRAVREREEVLSTGIGNGVAIPHGKSSAIHELALVAGVKPEELRRLWGKAIHVHISDCDGKVHGDLPPGLTDRTRMTQLRRELVDTLYHTAQLKIPYSPERMPYVSPISSRMVCISRAEKLPPRM